MDSVLCSSIVENSEKVSTGREKAGMSEGKPLILSTDRPTICRMPIPWYCCFHTVYPSFDSISFNKEKKEDSTICPSHAQWRHFLQMLRNPLHERQYALAVAESWRGWGAPPAGAGRVSWEWVTSPAEAGHPVQMGEQP